MEGKVQPQAIELEQAVLGAIMLEKNALAEAAEIISEDSFYLDAHKAIWRAIRRLDLKNDAIDLLTVTQELRSSNELEVLGGPFEVVKLTNSVTSSANIEAHCRIVQQMYMLREQAAAGSEMARDAYEPGADPFELLDKAEARLSAISNRNQRSKIVGIDSAVVKVLGRVETLRGNNSHLTGITSGYASMDKITHGWQSSDLIILAARPAVGKTALALNLVKNAASSGVPTAFFSLEMSTEQLTERMLSEHSGVWLEKIKTGQLEPHESQLLYQKGSELAELAIFIDDTPALNIFELRSKLRRLKNRHDIGFAIIDYLQLMSGINQRGQNREQEISTISRNLKAVAKELKIPIIALSQLSRAVENRAGDKMPQLSDLRESGAIEQDADMVMFIYRPEYYDITSDEMGETNKGETHIKIAKNRHGSLETIKLRAQLYIQKFVEMEGDDFQKPTGRQWRPLDETRMPYRDSKYADDSPW